MRDWDCMKRGHLEYHMQHTAQTTWLTTTHWPTTLLHPSLPPWLLPNPHPVPTHPMKWQLCTGSEYKTTPTPPDTHTRAPPTHLQCDKDTLIITPPHAPLSPCSLPPLLQCMCSECVLHSIAALLIATTGAISTTCFVAFAGMCG